MSYSYASNFPFKSFCKFAQHVETIPTIPNNVCEKSNDAYSFSIRVQTTINQVRFLRFFLFFTRISTSKKMFLFLIREFWACAYKLSWGQPRLSFRPPGFSPFWGREERRVHGLDYPIDDAKLPSSCTAFSQAFAVNWFLWRIPDERPGPRDPKRMTEAK